jgi:hypothetical protein
MDIAPFRGGINDHFNHQRRHSHCAMQSPINYEITYPIQQLQLQAA